MKLSFLALTLTLSFATIVNAQEVPDQEDAMKICKERGTRLPTAREFALYAEAFGGKLSDQKAEGSLYVNASDAPFYFSGEGYDASELEGCYWTSSVDTSHPLAYHDYKIYFNGDVGRFDSFSGMRNSTKSCKVKCL